MSPARSSTTSPSPWRAGWSGAAPTGDRHALLLLAGWVGLRLRVLGAAVLSARWGALREEALVLSGTGAGLAHGLREDPIRA